MSGFVFAALWWAVFGFSVWVDPRRVRNGVFLVMALWVTITLIVAAVSRTSESAELYVGLALIGGFIVSIVAVAIGLLLNGVTMLRRESRRPANLLSLLLGLGITALLVAWFVVLRVNSPGIAVWLLLLGLPLSYLGFVLVAFLLWSTVYLWWTRRDRGPIDAVIVLGAGLRKGRPGRLLAARLDTGLDLLGRVGDEAFIVVSGGQGADEPRSEAAAMAEYLTDAGLDPSRIMLEDESTTTQENLQFTAAILEQRGIRGRFAVVTNNFHAFRAALLLRSVGLDGIALGAPTARYFWPSAVLREYVAVLRDHLRLNAAVLIVTSLPLLCFVVATAVTNVG